MKTMTARWEWRTFGMDFKKSIDEIRQYPQGNRKTSDEIYILSRVKNNNIRIQGNKIAVKRLEATDQNHLEQWYPAMRENFPISANKIVSLLQFLGIQITSIKRGQYSYNNFIEELIIPNKLLKVVRVKKNRFIYVINQCIVELVDTEFEGIPFKTICIEHPNPEYVLDTTKMLGLDGLENVNYITAMKQVFHMH